MPKKPTDPDKIPANVETFPEGTPEPTLPPGPVETLPELFSRDGAITSAHAEALRAPFPDAAVERSSGAVTGKGYNTTGYKYQYVADRLNEVLGIGNWRTKHDMSMAEGKFGTGAAKFDVSCYLRLQIGRWLDGHFVVVAEGEGYGGHTAKRLEDAQKGALTNAFKKVAAWLTGAGAEAYRGAIDDDNIPVDSGKSEERGSSPSPSRGQRVSEPLAPRLLLPAGATTPPKKNWTCLSAFAATTPLSQNVAAILANGLLASWGIR